MANVHDVAAAIVKRTGQIDTFKLQKLAYYCQAWHLVWEGQPLFADRIEAWAAGPVVKELYQKHRGSYSVNAWEWGDAGALDEAERQTVELVVESYGKLSGYRLSQLTHDEDPWRDARGDLEPTARSDAEISVESMQEYYDAVASADDSELVADIEDF